MYCRRTSLAEDLMDIVSWSPWWAGVVLAVASYVLLHAVAGQPVAVNPKAPSVVGPMLERLARAPRCP
jgi:restriction system protein